MRVSIDRGKGSESWIGASIMSESVVISTVSRSSGKVADFDYSLLVY